MLVEKMTDLVGNTPMVSLSRLDAGLPGKIFVKLESMNPMSSVKDRIGLALIESAEREGTILPGATIIEPTSGNTGIGLAFAAAVKGYRVILTMPDTMSIERRKLLAILGAELVLTPGSEGMPGAIRRAEQLIAEIPGSYMPQQFTNPANPEIHRLTTGREILADMNGSVDAFVAAVGTGGSLSGVGSALREKIPGVHIAAVEPKESPVISGGKPGPHKIQGIGAGFIPGNLDTRLINEVITISADEAGRVSRDLARKEGILCGISAGANVAAALQLASRPEMAGKRIVTIICDTGERYLSSWLFEGIGS